MRLPPPWIGIPLALLAGLALLALVLKLAFPLPARGRAAAELPLQAGRGALAEQVDALLRAHAQPAATGLLLLPDGVDAFAVRLGLVREARRSVDAQYYIWEDDLSGRMLLSEIVAAADRGVRVRLLIDDNPTAGLDGMWAAVNAHPNIAVRLFNPLTLRALRPLNYLFDFPRLNRRMHNKSLTVDGALTVVGGRNVGDVYFGAKARGLFIDVDALAVGAVVPDVQATFDRYWSSAAAYDAETLLRAPPPEALAGYRRPPPAHDALADEYRAAAGDALARLLWRGQQQGLSWAPVRLVADHPDKALSDALRDDLMAREIAALLAGARQRLDLVSGYFVPGEPGTALLSALAQRGLPTRVVTNGVKVSDVPLVHAGYAPAREPLLKSGVQLFEARALDAQGRAALKLAQTRFSGGGESVHAKTFAIDERTLFLGSFNFDPRSALLNCEMGFVIDAPTLARQLGQALDERLPQMAYRLQLGPQGQLQWQGLDHGQPTTTEIEPGTTALQRALLWALSLLPIQWLL
ncbi:MAG: phospholipase D family protein [Proteobacteria bacterium]|nr:phospholipase D family protein [Pseudomonadota bacterium]